jgi:mono/diheme cytochrome c family protein
MRLITKARFLFLAGLVLLSLAIVVGVQAQSAIPSGTEIVQGALLYDRWYAALGVQPPAGNMPIWSRQTTDTLSGPDTWRCSECHGWDYRGAMGAYKSGAHYTGFPDVMTLASNLSVDQIVAHLKGANDPAHDFSKYMNDQALTQLAIFLKYGTIDDSHYIDPISLQVKSGDVKHGQQLYSSVCAACHGVDGEKIVFRSEGVDEYLGTVANRDPWRFLHRTRFGTAGTSMPVGYELGWSVADGRDILAFAQTLPTGVRTGTAVPGGKSSVPGNLIGGPATNLWTGILTGIGSLLGTVLGAVAFILILLGLATLVVVVLRKRA